MIAFGDYPEASLCRKEIRSQPRTARPNRENEMSVGRGGKRALCDSRTFRILKGEKHSLLVFFIRDLAHRRERKNDFCGRYPQ